METPIEALKKSNAWFRSKNKEKEKRDGDKNFKRAGIIL